MKASEAGCEEWQGGVSWPVTELFFTVKGQWFIYLIYYLINLDNILDVIKYTHCINSLSFEVVDNGIQQSEGLVIGAHLGNFTKFQVKAKLGKDAGKVL